MSSLRQFEAVGSPLSVVTPTARQPLDSRKQKFNDPPAARQEGRMFEMEMPEPELHEVVLEVPSRPPARETPGCLGIILGLPGGTDPGPEPVNDRVALGAVTSRITVEAVASEKDLQSFVAQQQQDAVFHAVLLSCSFMPKEGEEFVAAKIEIHLIGNETADQAAVIAWSMSPEIADRPVDVSRTLSLGGEAKIVKASMGRTESWTESDVFLQALRLYESSPTWELKKTPKTGFPKMQRLQLVTRSPVGTPAHGTIVVEASIDRPRLGLLRYESRLQPFRAPRFDLT
jgi:hypothetical protein